MQSLSCQICLYFAIVICLFSCSAPEPDSQDIDSPYRLKKLYYGNSQGERAITTFYYDLMGNNYMAHWQLEDSSRSSLNYHSLDINGNMIRKSRIFSDDIESEQEFKYDEAGRLVSEDFKRSDGVGGTTDYIFDENGTLVMADCRGLNGWFHGEIHYTYEGGIRTGADIIREKDSIGTIQYSYDGDRLVYEYWDINDDWNQTYDWEYSKATPKTFTSSNVFIHESEWFRIEKEYYDYNGQTGGPSYYYYDEDNRLTNKEFVRSDGLITMTGYEYDSTGKLRYSYRAFDGGDTTVFHYWYGIHRELLVRTWEHPDGSRGSETYRYDDEGLLTEGIYENMDGWLNGILVFKNDESRKPVQAEFRGDDGLDASVNFVYDLNQNLVKIFWEFSNGSTQTYNFIYGPHGFF